MFDLPCVAGEYKEPKTRLDPIIYELRKRRYELGWSSTLVSNKSGYSKTSIREWENGHGTPSFHALRAWCDTLGVELILKIKETSDAR